MVLFLKGTLRLERAIQLIKGILAALAARIMRAGGKRKALSAFATEVNLIY